MLQRLTIDQIKATFGDFRPWLQTDGTVAPGWERQILVTIPLPAPLKLSFGGHATTTRVHRLVMPYLAQALHQLYNDPEAWSSINDWGGCYCFRTNRKNPKAPSTHCWALGPDMDVSDNPQGAVPHVHPRVRAIMEAQGFLWGGTFHGNAVDGMHWEFADLQRLSVT